MYLPVQVPAVRTAARATPALGGLGAATPGAASLVQSAAVRYGVDPSLALAVAQQESGLDQSRVSSAGAQGVMQLMPATAAELGVNPGDLAGNIEGGVRYLAQLLRRFGDTALALAAYNAGPGAVDKYGGVPPYSETQSYVSSILGRIGAFFPPAAAPSSRSTAEVQPATDTWGPPADVAGSSAPADLSASDLSWLFSLPASAPDTVSPALVAVGAGLALWLLFRR